MRTHLHSLLFAVSLLAPGASFSADVEPYTIVIKNHRMVPTELEIPAGKKIRLVVDNQDSTPEEFESHSLNREKIIPGNSKATIYIGPLKPGTYEFFGEFNEATAQGRIIVK